MKYEYLTATQRQDILRQKRLQIEADHAALSLDLRLAKLVDLENEQVNAARSQLDILERQAHAIDDWLSPKAPEQVNANDGTEPAFP